MTRKSVTRYFKRQARQNKALNLGVKITGIMFLLIGVLGLVLPVIPGIVFLVVGVILLGEEFFISRWIIKNLPQGARDKLKKRNEKPTDFSEK